MPDLQQPPLAGATPSASLNVADRLSRVAASMPNAIAVACPCRFARKYPRARRGDRHTNYAVTTFADLDADVTRIARGLAAWAVPPGTPQALLVRPGIDFVALVFALLRAGMVAVLIDPGMGRRNVLGRLAEVEPEGFIALPTAQALRAVLRRRFPLAKWNVTVGHRWGWGGVTLDKLRMLDARCSMLDKINQHPASSIKHQASPDFPAAIIFTSGSTGPAKGVLYTHRMFDTQVSEIQAMYNIEAGGIDLSCFPLFALFNAAMGMTTVLPDMDFSRPATANPHKLLTAANDWQATQAFASPAVWYKLVMHSLKFVTHVPSLRQIFSCGAPVPPEVLESTLALATADAQMHTPYGATECLPISTIEAVEVLSETAAKTNDGAGVCVGRKFESIDWRIIRISDKPIATIDDIEELPVGEIGELIVRGPQASPAYVTRTECNELFKIADCGLRIADSNTQSEIPSWHRTGDVGYLDDHGRFWYCGRKAERVETTKGPLYTECVEAIFNTHPAVRRSALVGIGARGRQTPVIVIERSDGWKSENWDRELLQLAAAHPAARFIRHLLVHPSLPVDPRHNAKINREALAEWAANRLPELR
jgi:olefin beta-lactone synthetase